MLLRDLVLYLDKMDFNKSKTYHTPKVKYGEEK